MALNDKELEKLESMCRRFRIDLIEILHNVQTGHPGGSLSAAEIITALYFHILNVDPANPSWEKRDRFVLGKGHAAPMLYLALAEKGYFSKEELPKLRQLGSILQGHPCAKTTPGVDLSTGPLGLGLSAAVGMATAAKLDRENYRVYVLLGDGEIQEGIVWEAALAASKYRLDNLTAILDYNGVQLDGTVNDIMPLGDVAAKWRAFGWNVLEADGHEISEVVSSVEQAKAHSGAPTIIIARTVKGKGVSFMEGKNTWHGKPIGADEYATALQELGGR